MAREEAINQDFLEWLIRQRPHAHAPTKKDGLIEAAWRAEERELWRLAREHNRDEWVHYYLNLADFYYGAAVRCRRTARKIEALPITDERPRGGDIYSRYEPDNPNGSA